MKLSLAYVVTFLAGAALGTIVTTHLHDDAVGSPVEVLTSRRISPSSSVTPNSEAASLSFAEEDPALLPRDFACHPRSGESADAEFQRMLREIVQSPNHERQDRLCLLLARLRRGGAASVPVILEYLRSGRNVPSHALFGEVALFGGGSHYHDLRTLLFLSLAQIAESHPQLRPQIASKGLEYAQHLRDALALVDAAAKDPVTRQQAITAISRLTNPESIHSTYYQSLKAMVQLRSEELVETMVKLNEEKPFHHYVEAILGALWNFPDQTRIEMSKRLIDSIGVRSVTKNSPNAWLWLDAREPVFRNAIVQDFRAANDERARLLLLQDLAKERKSAQPRFHAGLSIGTTPPRPGAPDSREQTAARLALLNALAPYCNTLELRTQREESRATLTERLTQP